MSGWVNKSETNVSLHFLLKNDCVNVLPPTRVALTLRLMAKWRFLLVKSGRQQFLKVRVNPQYFGRGASRCVRRFLLAELVEAYPVRRFWLGARCYSLFPLKQFR